MRVLKVEVLDLEFKPFAPHGEALGFEFPSNYGSLHWGGFSGEVMSHLFLPV